MGEGMPASAPMLLQYICYSDNIRYITKTGKPIHDNLDDVATAPKLFINIGELVYSSN